MATQFLKCSPTERVSAKGTPVYIRLVLELAVSPFDSDFAVGMDRTYEGLWRTGLVFPVHPKPNVAGDTVATVDVRATGDGHSVTFSQLVTAVEELTYLTRVRSIERLGTGATGQTAAAGASAPAAREQVTARVEEQQQHEGILNQTRDTIVDAAKGIRTLLLVALVVAAIVGLVYAGGVAKMLRVPLAAK